MGRFFCIETPLASLSLPSSVEIIMGRSIHALSGLPAWGPPPIFPGPPTPSAPPSFGKKTYVQNPRGVARRNRARGIPRVSWPIYTAWELLPSHPSTFPCQPRSLRSVDASPATALCPRAAPFDKARRVPSYRNIEYGPCAPAGILTRTKRGARNTRRISLI